MNLRRCWRYLFSVFVLLSVLCSTSLTVLASTVENVPLDYYYDGADFGNDYEYMTYALVDDGVGNGDYYVRYNFGYGTYNSTDGWTRKSFLLSQNVNDVDMVGYENSVTFNRYDADNNNRLAYSFTDQFVLQRIDQTKIGTKGQNLTFSIKGVKEHLEGFNSNGTLVRSSYMDISNIKALYMYVYDQTGAGYKVLELQGSDVSRYITSTEQGKYINIGGEVSDLPVDAYKVNIFIVYGIAGVFTNNYGSASVSSQYWDSAQKFTKQWGFSEDASVTFKVNDNTSGLLSNIIGFIKSILEGVQNIFSKLGDIASSIVDSFSSLFSKLGTWFSDLTSNIGGWFGDLINKITSFITSVGNWFSTLFGHIIDLPGIMWGWIEDGLKALFVPDSAFIEDYKEDWEELMQDRFGALYQVIDAFSEFYDALSMQDNSNGTITLPKVSYTFDGSTFVFGGYSVKIIPDGFEFLVDSIKLIIDIVCTFLVMNSMKNKYERLVGDRL